MRTKLTMRSVLFLLIFLAMSMTAPAALQAALDSAGTEFYFAFQPNALNYGKTHYLYVYITGKEDTQGTVTIPGLNFAKSFTVRKGQATTISIPADAQKLGGNTIAKLGIHVAAEKEVTVYGLNTVEGTTDSFLVLPVDALGLEYLAMSYPGLSGTAYPSQVAVVGAFDDTTVTVTPAAAASGHPAGVPFTIILNRGDTYQIRGSGTTDITGTSITATAPVAVMSGTEASNVPVGYALADHLAEMMPPVASWGRSFLTVPLALRSKGEVFRILASQDGTEVRINGTVEATLNRGKYLEKILTSRSVIEASAPVLVSQYSPGMLFDQAVGDPFMMLISPTEQFLDQYTFSTAPGFSANYVNIVLPTSAISALTLDGHPLTAAQFSEIGLSGFSGAQVLLSGGSHTISGNAPFGIYVYGFGTANSYGYPGGMAFELINPSGDTFPPSVRLANVGDILQGVATDSEDINANGILDVDAGEDFNGNGVCDSRSEDLNGNGVLEPDEDANGNGKLDRDTGILKVELQDGASNLKLNVLPFVPGGSPVYFTISLLDPKVQGNGVLLVSDGTGNVTMSQISLSGVPTLKDVHVRNTVSTSSPFRK